jgi:sec-independent protein translocase protein TatB
MTFAFFFESTGGGEWLLLLAVILVVVGPKNLPGMLRKIGKITSTLRRAADEFRRQVMAMDEEVRSVVNEATKEMEIPDGSDAEQSPSTQSDSSDDDPDGNVDRAEDYGYYEDDAPYPGHDDAYDYDYDNGQSDSGPEMTEHNAEEPQEPSEPPKPADPENAAIKIVVSKAPGTDKS